MTKNKQNLPQPHPFLIDERITSTCFDIADWPLSRILLKNNADYPWLILVPRVENIQEIDQLSEKLRHELINEISALSTITRHYFKPDKLNVATLGNIVPQLHIHVVARYSHDTLWPHSVWQADQTTTHYSEAMIAQLLTDLRQLIH